MEVKRMKNLKGVVIIADGNGKRMALTYDVIDDNGDAIAQNRKVNKMILDDETMAAVKAIEAVAQKIIDAEAEV
jgi:hypothetical protein